MQILIIDSCIRRNDILLLFTIDTLFNILNGFPIKSSMTTRHIVAFDMRTRTYNKNSFLTTINVYAVLKKDVSSANNSKTEAGLILA